MILLCVIPRARAFGKLHVSVWTGFTIMIIKIKAFVFLNG